MDTVFGYFAGQVFDQSPAATCDFLMRTACLPNVTVEAAARSAATPTPPPFSMASIGGICSSSAASASRWDITITPCSGSSCAAARRPRRPRGVREALSTAGALMAPRAMSRSAFTLFREARDWPAATRARPGQRGASAEPGPHAGHHHVDCGVAREITAASPWMQFRAGIALLEIDQPQAALWLEPAYEGFVAAEGPSRPVVLRSGDRREPLQRNGRLSRPRPMAADSRARARRLATLHDPTAERPPPRRDAYRPDTQATRQPRASGNRRAPPSAARDGYRRSPHASRQAGSS